MPGASSVTTACLQAWSSGDFDTARSLIHDDISFVGPFGSAQGADAYLSGLRRFYDRGIQAADVRRLFADGDEVCIIYDLVTRTSSDTIATAAWYRVRAGRISSVRAFFDPRPLVPAPAGS